MVISFENREQTNEQKRIYSRTKICVVQSYTVLARRLLKKCFWREGQSHCLSACLKLLSRAVWGEPDSGVKHSRFNHYIFKVQATSEHNILASTPFQGPMSSAFEDVLIFLLSESYQRALQLATIYTSLGFRPRELWLPVWSSRSVAGSDIWAVCSLLSSQEPPGLFSYYNVHGRLITSPKGVRVRAEQLPGLFEKPVVTEPLVNLERELLDVSI